MKLHQKAYLLVELNKLADAWDYQLVELALMYNGQPGRYGRAAAYREKTIQVALDELAAAGLILRIEEKLETKLGKRRLFFRYQLSAFGRARMLDTGLLAESSH